MRFLCSLPACAFQHPRINAPNSACSSNPAWSRLLVATFRSLATTATTCGHHSEVNVSGLLLRCPAELPPSPFRLSLHHPPRLRTRDGRLHRSDPLPDDRPTSPASPRTSTPLWGFSSPRDQSVPPNSRPGKLALRIRPISLRSPPPIRFRFRLRINVPGPLRLRELAVPQTSWNLLHHALMSPIRQTKSGVRVYFSSCR